MAIYSLEQVIVNGIPVYLVEAAEIEQMRRFGPVDETEEVFLPETEYKGEGIYTLYYCHNDEKFYAVWDRSISARDYETRMEESS